ncbi:hypothetical protein K6Y31_18185 [Motilimonas cestriensis]|uniref:Uncharacterized protein n=1 Tax=Motilimonas cestriensis TaxID=2742685 RepID=A0ABS8WCF8_9GAMM|nr:hypothetical protein [Motilimonas cestriensis]MCE2596716.1 hypothetical protein [Motilimonas cestriensis]
MVIGLGTPINLIRYLTYFKTRGLAQRLPYIKYIWVGACLILGIHSFLNVGFILSLSNFNGLTVFAYLAAILLSIMILILTLWHVAPLANKHRASSFAILVCGVLLIDALNIPEMLTSTAFFTKGDFIEMKWYEPISLIFLIQMIVGPFLFLFSLVIKLLGSERAALTPLVFSFVMTLNGFIGAVSVFALFFE